MRSSLRLAGAVVFVLLAAGCLSGGGGEDVGTPTPPLEGPTTGTTVTTSTPSPGTTAPRTCPPPPTGTSTATPEVGTAPGSGTPTATVPDFEFSPDRETPVLLRNDWNRSVEIRVRVVCEPVGVTVHDEAYALDPGARLEAYDLTEASPDGGVPLRVVVTARNTTGSVTVRTTECADVTGQVLADGGVDAWATC